MHHRSFNTARSECFMHEEDGHMQWSPRPVTGQGSAVMAAC